MKRRTLHLSPEQHEQLAKRSQETGAPVAEIIRRAIDRYLTPMPRGARKSKTSEGRMR